MTIRIGDVVHAKNLKRFFNNHEASGHSEYGTRRDEHYVCILIGVEKKGDKPIQPDKVLNDLGWTFSPKEADDEG